MTVVDVTHRQMRELQVLSYRCGIPAEFDEESWAAGVRRLLPNVDVDAVIAAGDSIHLHLVNTRNSKEAKP